MEEKDDQSWGETWTMKEMARGPEPERITGDSGKEGLRESYVKEWEKMRDVLFERVPTACLGFVLIQVLPLTVGTLKYNFLHIRPYIYIFSKNTSYIIKKKSNPTRSACPRLPLHSYAFNHPYKRFIVFFVCMSDVSSIDFVSNHRSP